MRVIIVGAGICGLSTAIALKRVGIDVVIIEKLPQVSEEGAAISIWQNGLQALARLRLRSGYLHIFEPIEAITVISSEGRKIGVVPIARLANEYGPGAAMVYRPELTALLAQNVNPDQFVFNAELVSVEPDASGVVAVLQDGRRLRADLLIGADGIRSAVRRAVAPAELVYCRHAAWRGVTLFDHPFFRPRESFSVAGRGAYFVAHHLTNGRFYWIGTRASDRPRRIQPAAWKSEAERWFADWIEPVRALINATPVEAVLLNDIFSTVPTYALGKRTILLGDAAHASAPQLGQGANLALEDAVLFAHSLRQYGWPDGPAAFVQYRRARVKKVLAKSQALADLYHRNNAASIWLRNFTLRMARPSMLLRKAAWAANVELPALDGSPVEPVQYA